jgi:hypothetical protein
MSGFRRSFLGYRRSEVDAELARRDVDMAATERALQEARAKADDLDGVAERLSATVVERERELRELRQEVATLREIGVEGVRTLAAMGRQLDEIRTQARGQATQIRLRALRDAADLVDRVSDVTKLSGAAGGRVLGAIDEIAGAPGAEGEQPAASRSGQVEAGTNGKFEGTVHVDVGPLRDFSQLVRVEDAAESIDGTSKISIKRFSRGRATLSMELSEPVELLRELEERCDLEFKVRSHRDDSVILDVDEEQ